MKFTVEYIINRLSNLPKNMEVRVSGEFAGTFGINEIAIFEGDDFVTIEMNTHDFIDND